MLAIPFAKGILLFALLLIYDKVEIAPPLVLALAAVLPYFVSTLLLLRAYRALWPRRIDTAP